MGQARVRRALATVVALIGLVALIEPAQARHRLSFVPGHHGGAAAYRHFGARHAGGGRGRQRGYFRRRGAPSAGADEGATAPPPPGSGFKMEDGVLTYPAPARFQPQNLKHL